jgi:hypothetical protein
MKWLRLYSDVVSDPKVQRLAAERFKAWINLLCVAGQHDGILPPMADLAFTLRIAEDKIASRCAPKACAVGQGWPSFREGSPGEAGRENRRR